MLYTKFKRTVTNRENDVFLHSLVFFFSDRKEDINENKEVQYGCPGEYSQSG